MIGSVRRPWVMRCGVPLVVAALLVGGSRPASAQIADREIIVVRSASVTEAAVSACAGGAAIGVLLVWASGAGSAAPTAGLFCGLSVAATVAASTASYAWRSVGGLLP